jgi:hypothetical protein
MNARVSLIFFSARSVDQSSPFIFDGPVVVYVDEIAQFLF